MLRIVSEQTQTSTRASRIRPALPSDWDAIAALLEQSALPLDDAREHITDFLVAETNTSLAGCAGIERHGSAGLLRSVAVAPSHRGIGLGVALVEAALHRAREAGMTTVTLLTTTADRFFPRFGFRATDRASVPTALLESVEFRTACPATATVMHLVLT